MFFDQGSVVLIFDDGNDLIGPGSAEGQVLYHGQGKHLGQLWFQAEFGVMFLMCTCSQRPTRGYSGPHNNKPPVEPVTFSCEYTQLQPQAPETLVRDSFCFACCAGLQLLDTTIAKNFKCDWEKELQRFQMPVDVRGTAACMRCQSKYTGTEISSV